MPLMINREAWQAKAATHFATCKLPLVTLSYAQTLDGSLTLHAGEPSPVSGPAAMRVTHQLRAAHDAILIGIGTVLADDPRLTVRLIDGQHPQPIVLDSQLRFPQRARLLDHPRGVWIATTASASSSRAHSLKTAGARIMAITSDEAGRVDLLSLLETLGKAGMRSVMVEGGSQVLTSFIKERLADEVAITVAPVFAGGYRAMGQPAADTWSDLPRLVDVHYEQAGADLILLGRIE